ncbi:hypothetical protein [Streptomyces sp. MMG1121]|uniref:hypothetical protein n=1 Tax=Streptomyces sp. MMG1121 TaxID=1415544 RepID=UPI000A71FA00|nr:hypothetical protein [Streptomyces sp. MMG1121]
MSRDPRLSEVPGHRADPLALQRADPHFPATPAAATASRPRSPSKCPRRGRMAGIRTAWNPDGTPDLGVSVADTAKESV